MAAPPTPLNLSEVTRDSLEPGHQLPAEQVAGGLAAHQHQAHGFCMQRRHRSGRNADKKETELVGFCHDSIPVDNQCAAASIAISSQTDLCRVADRFHADDRQIGLAVLDRFSWL
ncbi:MAG: hypothetical protein WDM89_02280 [Rhizomicrobium sp.]